MERKKKYVGNSLIREPDTPRDYQRDEKNGYNAWHDFTEIVTADPFDDYKEVIRRMKKNSER